MTGTATIHDYAFHQMNRLLTALGDRVQGAAAEPGPNEIHDLRVSIRRFSQALQLFSDQFPKKEVKQIRTRLKSLMRLTSEIRDRDITLEFLAERGDTAHRPRLEKERRTYQRQLSTLLRRWSARDFAKLAEQLKPEPDQTALETAREVLPKLARKYFEAGRDAIEQKRPPDKLHDFRLQTKRFRYTLEVFRPVYGPQLERYLNSLRSLQGALGQISDYQSIQRSIRGDRQLETKIRQELKQKVQDLRAYWRKFDSAAELKRWRSYLAGERPKPKSAA